jgi:hypothetical protein
MAVPEDRLQQIIKNKDAANAAHWVSKYGYVESWQIIDGALVICDLDDPPVWLKPILELKDDDGNTAHVLVAVVPVTNTESEAK